MTDEGKRKDTQILLVVVVVAVAAWLFGPEEWWSTKPDTISQEGGPGLYYTTICPATALVKESDTIFFAVDDPVAEVTKVELLRDTTHLVTITPTVVVDGYGAPLWQEGVYLSVTRDKTLYLNPPRARKTRHKEEQSSVEADMALVSGSEIHCNVIPPKALGTVDKVKRWAGF